MFFYSASCCGDPIFDFLVTVRSIAAAASAAAVLVLCAHADISSPRTSVGALHHQATPWRGSGHPPPSSLPSTRHRASDLAAGSSSPSPTLLELGAPPPGLDRFAGDDRYIEDMLLLVAPSFGVLCVVRVAKGVLCVLWALQAITTSTKESLLHR